MKKIRILLFLPFFLIFLQYSFAEKVDSKTAQILATNFYFEKCLQSGIEIKQPAVLTLSHTQFDGNDEIYYVFSSDNGFIIVAADDDSYPVLGYSFEGKYSDKNLSPEFKFWMNTYEKQIINIRHNHLKANTSIVNAWDNYINKFNDKEYLKDQIKSVEPLLMSVWDQGTFYNSLCPEDAAGPDGHVWAGCVATAMAQVMYYYRYPLQGSGSHNYYSPYGFLSADFGSTTYHWDAMQNDISSNYNYDMALLQLHCGIAIEMDYSPDGSGASMWEDAHAMKNYFGYSNTTEVFNKNDYSMSQWTSMLRTNIDNKMPIQYAGYGDDGGHAFVCDGYLGTEYFHFNWGWGGAYNGYFYLDNLNPGFTFNYGQQAILNSYPASAYPQVCSGVKTITGLYGTLEDGSGPNYNYQNNMDCIWLIAPDDSVEFIRLNFERLNTEASNDVITIYDGASTFDSVLGTFSGNTIPGEITSSGPKVLVRFTTNADTVSDGWLMTYSAKEVRFCNSIKEFTTPSGTFTDGSGTYEYNNSTFCRWRIHPQNVSSITVQFNNFDLANDQDFIRVFDAEAGSEINTFYAGAIPQTFTVYSDELIFLFRTSGVYNADGWEISYTSIPLSVGENQKGFVKILPNPAVDYLKIQAAVPGVNSLTINLFNNTGQCVLTKPLAIQNDMLDETLDISALAGGVYFLKINSDKFNHSQKLIIR